MGEMGEWLNGWVLGTKLGFCELKTRGGGAWLKKIKKGRCILDFFTKTNIFAALLKKGSFLIPVP